MNRYINKQTNKQRDKLRNKGMALFIKIKQYLFTKGDGCLLI